MRPNVAMELKPKQLKALNKFREAVADVEKPIDDDCYLLQWLKARDYDPQKAENMLRKSMAWRSKIGADQIVESWTPPEAVSKYSPRGMPGVDKTGCPVWIMPFGRADMMGLLNSVTTSDLTKTAVLNMETSRQEMARQSQLRGSFVHQQVVIIDMEGLSLKDSLCRQAQKETLRLYKLYEENYPETLKKVLTVNAPGYFTFIYNVFKNLLSDSTRQKIEVYDSDRSKWLPAILELVDPDQLPKHWGGNMVDPDGNPMCPSMINLGGKVPESYYLDNKAKEGDLLNMVSIKSGNCHEVEFQITEINSRLRWEFQTENHDIAFAIQRKCQEEWEEIVPYSRVDSHMCLIEGETQPLALGTYIVIFDNSYSKIRSKNLCYSVEVISDDHTNKCQIPLN